MFAGFLGERRGDVFQNGFTQNTNMMVSTDNGLHFATTLANPFPLGVAEPVGAAAGLQTYLGQGFTYFNQNPKIPITMRWEASLQHQFKQFLLEANYIGNKTNHIEITRNINTLPRQYLSTLPTRDDTYNNLLTATIANPLLNLVPGNSQGTYTGTTTSRQTLLSPFPAFGSNAINTTENTGYSWYHSFQFTASKRFAKGYTVQGSYTFSEVDAGGQSAECRRPRAGPRDLRLRRAAPHQHLQRLVAAFRQGPGAPEQYQRFRVASRRRLGSFRHLEHPERIRTALGQHALLRQTRQDIQLPLDQRTPEHWFNVANFETASAKQLLGNQVRTWPFRFPTLRGPRQNNVDIALIKDTRISEGKNLQFRLEALNAANHPYFPNPNMTVTAAQTVKDTGFGQISASTQSNYARRLQMALRLVF